MTDSITYIAEEMFLGKDIHLRNEFHPNLYTLGCKLTSSLEGQSYAHEKSTTFGMREVEAGEDHIILNGEPIHPVSYTHLDVYKRQLLSLLDFA